MEIKFGWILQLVNYIHKVLDYVWTVEKLMFKINI